jgi:hypothetical protein
MKILQESGRTVPVTGTCGRRLVGGTRPAGVVQVRA